MRQTWMKVLGVLAAVAVVLVVVVAVLNRDTDEVTSAPGEDTPTGEAQDDRSAPSRAGELVPDAMGRQVLDVGDTPGEPLEQTAPAGGFPSGAEPVGPPAVLELQRGTRGVTVAVSNSDGPTGVEGNVLTGYAQSARGAALLAVTHRGVSVGGGPEYLEFLDYYYPSAREQLSSGVIEEIESKDATRMREYLATGYVAPSWVKVRDCGSDFCTVETADAPMREVLGHVPEGAPDSDQYGITRLSVVWKENRWQIVSMDAFSTDELDDEWERWL